MSDSEQGLGQYELLRRTAYEIDREQRCRKEVCRRDEERFLRAGFDVPDASDTAAAADQFLQGRRP